MIGKQRLSATVDAELLAAAEHAAASGSAKTISAWVNDALRLKLEHDRRLQALARFVAETEAKHGLITESDITRASRAALSRAVAVRGRSSRSQPKRRRSR